MDRADPKNTRALDVAGRRRLGLAVMLTLTVLAHYFTYLLVQGQFVVPLASDPLARGWDLLGTAAYRPDIGVVGARFAWYTAVIAIVLGHIVAVFVAHVTALREFGSRSLALRSSASAPRVT